MDIKKGMRFLCIKDVVMNDGSLSYKEGRTYLSEWNNCITDEEGDASHIWTELEDYFIPLQKVEYVWTEATPELKKLFENYKGKREGQRRDMSKVRYFSNKAINPQDTAFTAHEVFEPLLLYKSVYYMTPSTFIEFMGLETVKQEAGKGMDYEFYIGRKILGFKFSQSDYPNVGWDDGMEGNIYRAGVIEEYNESNNSFSVRFEDLKAWCYPADMVVNQIEGKDALVELSNSESYDTEDPVNSPSHYTGKIEVIEFIEDKELGFHLGNSVKYISRAGKKDPRKTEEDLKKAIWYIERYIEIYLKADYDRGEQSN